MKKIAIAVCALLGILMLSSTLDAYNYSYYEEPIETAPAMIIKDVITSDEMLMSYEDNDYNIRMTNPVDVFVYDDQIYIVDNEQDKLIVLDEDYNVTREYPSSIQGHPDHSDSLDENALLNNPSSVHVDESTIAVADTDNARIAVFDHDFNLIETHGRPDDITFEQSEIDYRPQKITRDTSGRFYVVAQGIYEGIIELESNGAFTRYTGVTRVAVTPLEVFWMNFMTEEQREQMQLRLPPSFLNVHMNRNNFLYTVSNPSDPELGNNMIKRINPRGIDVLKDQGFFPPKGDVEFVLESEVVESGPSSLNDITVNDYGIYSVLDNRRGRIFTYDHEGNLLYITGRMGSQRGNFNSPQGLDYHNDDLVVVDSEKRSLNIYELTEFGSLVNKATEEYSNSEYDAAAESWEEVLKLNSNYFIAYRGIGRAALRNGEYKEAMEYFELSNDEYNYSLAYKEYRNERLETYFPFLMSVIGIVIFYLFYSSIRNSIRVNKDTGREE